MEQQRNHGTRNSIEGGRAARRWRSIIGGALRSHGSPVEEEQVTGHAPGGSLKILACADGGRAASPVEGEQQQSGRRGQNRLRGGAAASPTGEVAGSPIERERGEGGLDGSRLRQRGRVTAHGGMCGRERIRFN
jgi:hypothetical protein